MPTIVALVIEDRYHARNYLTGLVDFAQEENLEFHLFLPSNLVEMLDQNCGQKSITFIDFGSRNHSLFEFLKQADKVKNRGKSKSFRYALKRRYPPLVNRLIETFNNEPHAPHGAKESYSVQETSSNYKNLFLRLFHFLTKRVFKLTVFLTAYSPFYVPIRNVLCWMIRENELVEELTKINPDLVVYVNSLHEYTSIPLRRLCLQLKKPYFVIADNWDNLSSKRTLWERPDFVGVWGEQTRQHARAIHGMHEESIISIGSPRLTPIFSYISKPSIKDESGKLQILFAGSSLPFNEQKFIFQTLETCQLLGLDVKLTYRPYPWRAHDIDNSLYRFEGFELDLSIARDVTRRNTQDFSPKFEAYAKLIHCSDLVIGGLTTMLLESAMLGKSVIALVHQEGSSIHSPHLGFRNYTHFEGLEKFQNITLCQAVDDFQNILSRQLKHLPNHSRASFETARDWFYDPYARANFNTNFINQIASIVSKTNYANSPAEMRKKS